MNSTSTAPTREPYYQDELVTLYHGDCLEADEWLAADVLVTDPPYGMAYTGFGGRSYWNDASKHAPIAGDSSAKVRDAALAAWCGKPAIVFGTWRVERPAATKALVVWHKVNAGGMGDLTIPWLPTHEEIYILGSGFVGKRSDAVLSYPPLNSADRSRPDHPTPKPLALMERLIETTVGTIADPFSGSGSTLLAARNLGRRVIGVEVEERYCELIAKRLAQDVLDFGGVA